MAPPIPTRDPVAFVHLPRTAGSTLNGVIRRRYPRVVKAGWSEWRAHFADPSGIPDADAYVGHMPYGLHELLGRRVAYVTLVRRPVARTVSLYHFLRGRDDPGSDDAPARPLEEWAPTTEPNQMTVRLAGDRPGDRELARRSDPALLDRALANAEGFVAVGTQERFVPSLNLVAHRLGWGVPRYHSRKVSPPYPSISAEAARIISERNLLDLALYEALATRLDADLRSLGRRIFLLQLRNAPALDAAEEVARRARHAILRTDNRPRQPGPSEGAGPRAARAAALRAR